MNKILTFVMVWGIQYLIFVFIAWNFNPADWSGVARFLFAFFIVASGISIAVEDN